MSLTLQKCRNCGSRTKVESDRHVTGGWTAWVECVETAEHGCASVTTHATRLRVTATRMASASWNAMQLADTSGK
jgi:hypothetical protein